MVSKANSGIPSFEMDSANICLIRGFEVAVKASSAFERASKYRPWLIKFSRLEFKAVVSLIF